jgi:hypothetical protein
LLDFLIGYRGKAAILTFRPLIEELLDPSNLEKESNVRVDALLLKKEVVCLMELLESEFLLRKLAQVHHQFAWYIKLNASS